MSNTAVRYFSKSGNTEKVADVIAKAADCQAKPIPEPVNDQVDILFLGASVYWGGISSEVKDYIQKLDKSKIGKVVIFSTSALAERAYPQMKKELLAAGLIVEDKNFYCRGQFTALHRDLPDQDDLQKAAQFTNEILNKR